MKKIISMLFKKYQFLFEKLLKRKFLKKFENFKRKIQNFNNSVRKMFEFFQICGCFVS